MHWQNRGHSVNPAILILLNNIACKSAVNFKFSLNTEAMGMLRGKKKKRVEFLFPRNKLDFNGGSQKKERSWDLVRSGCSESNVGQ